MLEEIGWVVAEGTRLGEWEEKFVHSMHQAAAADWDLSNKQQDALRRIWYRVYKKEREEDEGMRAMP